MMIGGVTCDRLIKPAHARAATADRPEVADRQSVQRVLSDQHHADCQNPAQTQANERRHDHRRRADDPDQFEELHVPLPMENEDEMDQSDFNDNEPESTRQEKPGQLRRPFSLLLQENGGAGENSFPAFVNRSATPEAVPSKTSLPLVGQVARGIIKVVQVAQRFTGWRRFVWLAAGSVLLALASSALAKWDAENSGTKSSLRAVHNASPGVAWAGGTNGVILRSEDDGYLWQQCAIPPGAENLDFRGVWGWNADHAIAMSSGPGSASRLYETTDGCAHWRSAFANPEPAGFWDAIAFWNQQQGMLLGDPVNGRFRIFKTSDGGRHWSRDESAGLEIDPGGESAFAASNSALVLGPDGMSAYFATGGTGGCRIFRFHPGVRGQPGSWTSAKLPLAHNAESAGIFSLAFRDSKRGVAVGGDYKQPNQIENTTAWTSDGGLTWAGASKPPSGYRSAVAWDRNSQAWIAVGPNGSDVSYDDGKTWRQFDRASWNALSLPWVVGPDGRIAMLNRSALDKSLK